MHCQALERCLCKEALRENTGNNWTDVRFESTDYVYWQNDHCARGQLEGKVDVL